DRADIAEVLPGLTVIVRSQNSGGAVIVRNDVIDAPVTIDRDRRILETWRGLHLDRICLYVPDGPGDAIVQRRDHTAHAVAGIERNINSAVDGRDFHVTMQSAA